MKIFLLVLGLAVAATAASQESTNNVFKPAAMLRDMLAEYKDNPKDVTVDLANKIVDSVLGMARELMIENGLDPMQLPDIHEGFSFKPIIIEYHGEIDLTKGWLSDASTIYRLDNVGMSFNNNMMSLKIPVGFRDFVFDYQYSAKLMGLGPSGGIDGKCTDIQLYIDVLVDFETLEIMLNDFQIIKTGKITLKWSGNPLIDWLANALTGVVTGIFKGLIINICESIVKGTLEAIFAIINDITANLPKPEFIQYIPFEKIIN